RRKFCSSILSRSNLGKYKIRTIEIFKTHETKTFYSTQGDLKPQNTI
ncbi:MAG: hypothetical protein ACI9SG_002199, partial [Maribacter sp.]